MIFTHVLLRFTSVWIGSTLRVRWVHRLQLVLLHALPLPHLRLLPATVTFTHAPLHTAVHVDYTPRYPVFWLHTRLPRFAGCAFFYAAAFLPVIGYAHATPRTRTLRSGSRFTTGCRFYARLHGLPLATLGCWLVYSTRLHRTHTCLLRFCILVPYATLYAPHVHWVAHARTVIRFYRCGCHGSLIWLRTFCRILPFCTHSISVIGAVADLRLRVAHCIARVVYVRFPHRLHVYRLHTHVYVSPRSASFTRSFTFAFWFAFVYLHVCMLHTHHVVYTRWLHTFGCLRTFVYHNTHHVTPFDLTLIWLILHR